jgi:HEAT repeats
VSQLLLRLIRDADDDVRDRANFGLGALGNIDSDEIREALVGRLEDSDEDVRQEAMVGRGKTRDQRVLSMLAARFAQPEISVRVIEAAYLTLEMDTERQGWRGADYALAPRQHFSLRRSFAIFDPTFPSLPGIEFAMNGRTGRKPIGPRRLLRSLVHQSNHPALTTVGSGESFIGGRKVSLLCDRYPNLLVQRRHTC